MNNSNTNKQLRFERQRKNLMISSLLMMVYIWVGLEFKTINLLGNQATIRNEGKAENVLWLIFLYLLIRYVQCFLTIKNEEFTSYNHVYLTKYVKSLASKINKKRAISDILKKEPRASDFQYENNDVSIFEKNPHYWTVGVRGNISYNLEQSSKSRGLESIRIRISRRQLYIHRLRSGCKIVFLTPYFTEYLLPFVLAVAAIILKIINAVLTST